MSQYLSLIKMRFINGLQYRVAALAGMVTQFAFGYMFISQYLAFYRTNPAAFPMGVSQIVSYIWVQQAFLGLFFTWFYDNSIFAAIVSGQIAYEMARPMDLYGKWYCQNIANRLSSSALRCFPILIIGFLMPEPYKLILPPGAAQLLLFLISSLFALAVVVSFSMLIYISAFYTMSPVGIRLVAAVLADFMAGAIVPLPFFPEKFRRFAEILPFAAMQNMPLRIYGGNLPPAEAVNGICLQLFWLAVMLALGRLWMGKALRKVVVQGG